MLNAPEMVLTTVGICITLYSGNLLVHINVSKLGNLLCNPNMMGMKWWTGGIFVSHTVLSKWSSCSLNSHQLKALLSTYTSISLKIYAMHG